MRRILLVTAREYWRMVTLPGFWITALIVPVFILAAPIARRFLGQSKTAGYVLAVSWSKVSRLPITPRTATSNLSASLMLRLLNRNACSSR